LSDKIGRKRLLIIPGAVFVIAPLLYLFISDPFMRIPVRFFHGTGTAILGPVVSAILVERFPLRKGEALGQYSSASLMGRTLAPLTGGAVISYFALYTGLISYQFVYLVAFIAAIPALVITILYCEKDSKSLVLMQLKDFSRSFKAFFWDRVLRATAFCRNGDILFIRGVRNLSPGYPF